MLWNWKDINDFVQFSFEINYFLHNLFDNCTCIDQAGIFWPITSQNFEVKSDRLFRSPTINDGKCHPWTIPAPPVWPMVTIIPENARNIILYESFISQFSISFTSINHKYYYEGKYLENMEAFLFLPCLARCSMLRPKE